MEDKTDFIQDGVRSEEKNFIHFYPFLYTIIFQDNLSFDKMQFPYHYNVNYSAGTSIAGSITA